MVMMIKQGLGVFQRNVRRGFLIVVVASTTILSSTLWAAIAMMPYFQHPVGLSPAPLMNLTLRSRSDAPTELAWFFIQYAYLSEDIHIRAKNHHTFMISDRKRGREYVVGLGQNFRRVEIYFTNDKARTIGECLHAREKARCRNEEWAGW